MTLNVSSRNPLEIGPQATENQACFLGCTSSCSAMPPPVLEEPKYRRYSQVKCADSNPLGDQSLQESTKKHRRVAQFHRRHRRIISAEDIRPYAAPFRRRKCEDAMGIVGRRPKSADNRDPNSG